MTKTQMALLGVAIVVLTPFAAMQLLTRKTILHDPRLLVPLRAHDLPLSAPAECSVSSATCRGPVPSREKPGQMNYFLQQGGNQFGAEGMAIGSFYTAVGLLTAFNVYVLLSPNLRMTKRVVGMLSIGRAPLP